MAALLEYSKARERWTWRNQLMNDGTTKILSNVQVQTHDDCAYFALVTTLEANLRVQLQRSVSLSVKQLRDQYETSKASLPPETKITRLLRMIKDGGIFEERQYNDFQKGTLGETDARKYKVVSYLAYSLNNLDHIKHAMWRLRSRGPLLAVIYISKNYHECKNSGVIYRFDPDRALKSNSGVVMTHAVSVVSFAIEAKVPCLECQDSQGRQFGRDGFLVVDITSLVELYSIKMV